jgi:hypothetical protein
MNLTLDTGRARDLLVSSLQRGVFFNNRPAPRVEMLVLPVDQITETAPRVEPTTAPAGGSTENLAPTARPAAAE